MHPVLAAVATLAAPRLALAVSGGRDSMALLEACARACPERVAVVATFDHGTGTAAARAATLVARRARALGFAVAHGRAREVGATEAAWRAARWRFLRRVASDHEARVATAHTRDDLLETVVMRALRGSGARGLAAMLAPSPVVRPFLDLSRGTVAEWAGAEGVRWVDDPTNASPRHLRNRVRHELLPAIALVRPGFGAEMLALAREAAHVRARLDEAARALSGIRPDGALFVAAPGLSGYDPEALGALWPALAGRVGVVLDRRGTSRLVAFTRVGRPGGTIPLSGGYAVVRVRGGFLLGRATVLAPGGAAAGDEAGERPLSGATEVGAWRLRPARPGDPDDLWSADLPADRPLAVRPWRAGDRMPGAGAGGAARRVKRFFGDARVPGMDRAGWPVVLAGGEIVWIPGVRRGHAASDRSGRPGVRYVCERIHGGPATRGASAQASRVR